ncbi:class I SAM-dependent methyltransferase [Xanthomonas maliensis]|uniref:class I SAM-dependent methyltransferase n=1 Tax=Xanthomonas maliensis TaxID=1321368 RepID=UPI0003A09F9D|nr:class I SAM-dependent methyltransferase [Xanthomonas maliensis]KAB7765274.1 SAM-dependent methyltransferase [Xanthomonas maliensis]
MEDNALPAGASAPRGQLISHSPDPPPQDEALLRSVRSRLIAAHADAPAQLDVLLCQVDALWTFEFGRFLLRNRGLNADWAHQIVTYRPGTLTPASTPALQYALFERLPSMLATRERFGIFRRQLQRLLRPGLTLASIPCGYMSELLTLDYRHCPDVRLLGSDLDPQALEGARALAQQHGLERQVALQLADAWAPGEPDSVDVLTSNGLNIYEPDDARVVALYRAFFARLRPAGMLVTSCLTPSPAQSAQSPWKLAAIDACAAHLQAQLFREVIQTHINVRTPAHTRAQLERAGFVDVRVIEDSAGIFPTFIASKPGPG